ncbi:hypothetical protein V6N13_071537 [Hibiscus sabdariffa]|uniref:Uncharacterized protein n=1 Tax=Hibiscus sabdariffa TaxID=183260 RepID=A0ABR2TDH7_9ROSI
MPSRTRICAPNSIAYDKQTVEENTNFIRSCGREVEAISDPFVKIIADSSFVPTQSKALLFECCLSDFLTNFFHLSCRSYDSRSWIAIRLRPGFPNCYFKPK